MNKPRFDRAGLPYNPQLRDLIAEKRRSSSRIDVEIAKQGFPSWHERGYLPHRDEPGLTQFVTIRLADSFPESLRSEWAHLWKIEDDQERRKELESYLDLGRGECHLRRPDIAMVVENAIRFFDGDRYTLLGWVVMPNHVHTLFTVGSTPMKEIIESWKKHTAFKANQLLNRKGEFWQADYWDTYMRDAEQTKKAVRYIDNNPSKARLALDPKDWKWSSARFRDEYGTLRR